MKLLLRHPDKSYVYTLLEIICGGVKIGYTGLLKIMVSPSLMPSLTRYISSLLGLKSKPDSGWQCNHHLLYPRSNSVNCHISRNYGALEYTSINNVLSRNIIKYNDLQSVYSFFSFAAKMF